MTIYRSLAEQTATDDGNGRFVTTEGLVAVVMLRKLTAGDWFVFSFRASVVSGTIRIEWQGSVAYLDASVADSLIARGYARLAVAGDFPAPTP